MTRDEAIETMLAAASKQGNGGSGMAAIVDGLAALGVLKLDWETAKGDPTPRPQHVFRPGRCEPLPGEADRSRHLLKVNGYETIEATWLEEGYWQVGPDTITAEEAYRRGMRYLRRADPKRSAVNREELHIPDPKTYDGPMISDVVAAAPTRCEPPPEHREKRWHWLRNVDTGVLFISMWLNGEWFQPVLHGCAGELHKPAFVYQGWRYVAPCEEPKP